MTIQVQHKPFQGLRIEVATSLGFDEVLTRLRAQMGRASLDEIVTLAQTLPSEADFIRTVQERFEGESGFMLFAEVDHGGWLSTFGIHRRAVRWILGNPLLAITMIRHDISAGLFAPVEILVTEADDGRGAIYCDLYSPIDADGGRREPAAPRRCNSSRRQIRHAHLYGHRSPKG